MILNYEYEWCDANTTPFIGSPDLSGHTYEAFPGLYKPLSKNEPLFGLVKESTNDYFREVMEMQDIKSYYLLRFFQTMFFGAGLDLMIVKTKLFGLKKKWRHYIQLLII